MAWATLVFSGMMESVWAIALDRSEGFSHIGSSIVFVVGLLLSMGGLAFALRYLPVGTAYAVWAGIGASLTVTYGMVTGTEPVSMARIVLLAGLIVCIVGLKLVGGASDGGGCELALPKPLASRLQLLNVLGGRLPRRPALPRQRCARLRFRIR